MTEFKVGDIVKRKESMWKGIEAFTLKPFDKFEVSAYFSDCKFPLVCFKESGSYQWDAAYFELVEEEKVKNKFTVGDRVISVKNTPSVPEGFIGTVTGIDDFSFPIAVTADDGHYAVFEQSELELLSVGKPDIKDIKVRHDSVGLSFDDPLIKITPADFVGIKGSALDKQVSGDHYKDCKIQPIEYIFANGLSYLEGNVIKYTTRHSKKNGRKDIEKAIHYLELILEMEYKDKE